MHVGKLVFAQLMDHLPRKTFGRIVERYGGIIGFAISAVDDCHGLPLIDKNI